MNKFKMLAVVVALSLAVSGAFAQKGGKKGKGEAKKAASGDVAKGKDLFEAKCMVCHNPDSKDKKIGPGLQGVKDGKLPSGKNATHDVILEVVDAGGGGMPAYKELLTDEEKEDVIAYVLTL
ncbi:MAG: cytochrome c [Acidobacteria bacterium]|nr:cytochrome c [Acidobacteriota bacterium]